MLLVSQDCQLGKNAEKTRFMFYIVHELQTTRRSTWKKDKIKSPRLSAIVMQQSLMFYQQADSRFAYSARE